MNELFAYLLYYLFYNFYNYLQFTPRKFIIRFYIFFYTRTHVYRMLCVCLLLFFFLVSIFIIPFILMFNVWCHLWNSFEMMLFQWICYILRIILMWKYLNACVNVENRWKIKNWKKKTMRRRRTEFRSSKFSSIFKFQSIHCNDHKPSQHSTQFFLFKKSKLTS